jgi:phosphomannomutase
LARSLNSWPLAVTTVGPDPVQIASLLGDIVAPVVQDFDYGFAENGLTAYKHGVQLPSQSFINFVGEERYKPLVNFILHYIADLDIPLKR